MKRLGLVLVGAVCGILGGALFLLSGLPNIAASKGQTGAIDWLQTMAGRQSVSLRSAAVAVPQLDDAALVARGAGHYEMVCAQCHGSPAGPPAQIANDMVPEPPRLLEQMQHWRPSARTFWTVKHGIRQSAMPAWPSQLRDDEVWAVVAFIEAMPEMTAAQYTELTGRKRGACASCHGEDGGGRGGVAPRLDIQSPAYIAAALRTFRDGTRASGTMIAVARGLSDTEIDELATLFGRRSEVPPDGNRTGQEISERGAPERDIPACNSCHGSSGRADYPRLAGQWKPYLRTQLMLFREHGTTRGGAHADIMAKVAKSLAEDHIAAIVDWYGREPQ